MVYIVNIFVILLAIFFALHIATEKKKYREASAVISLGVFAYLFEALMGLFSAQCEAGSVVEFFKVFDDCANYMSGTVIASQAMIIGGFTFVFVSYGLSKNPKE